MVNLFRGRRVMEEFVEVIGVVVTVVIGLLVLLGLMIAAISALCLSIPSKSNEQIQCESVEGAVWGKDVCFKNGIKLNFAE